MTDEWPKRIEIRATANKAKNAIFGEETFGFEGSASILFSRACTDVRLGCDVYEDGRVEIRTVNGDMVLREKDLTCELDELVEIVKGKDDGMTNIEEALSELINHKPGFPESMRLYYEDVYGEEEAAVERKRCEEAPFFSEAYQYELLGKEEGRVILALLNNVLRILGYEGYQDARLQESEDDDGE